MSKLKKLLNLFSDKTNEPYKPNKLDIDKSALFSIQSLSIRHSNNSNSLTIGRNSVVKGQFVFEKPTGTIQIGNNTFIGGGQFICTEKISIGDDVMLSWGCTVIDTNSHSIYWEQRKDDVLDWKKGIEENTIGKYKNWDNVESSAITIKDKAWVGFNVIILKGVTIGERSVIGAGSVVTTDIPDDCIAVGNPAKVIKNIEQ